MTKLRILHLTRDEKFINAANFLFEKAFEQQNTFLILKATPELTLKYVTPAENVVPVVAAAGFVYELLATLEDYDVIVFHGLDALRRQMILKASPAERRKFLWIYWGSEIYREGLWDQSLFGAKTLALHDELDPPGAPTPTPEQVNRNKEAIFLLQTLGIQCPEETDFLKSNGAIHKDTVSIPFTYYPLEYLFDDLSQRISGNDILIGNSASFSNNHLEALDILAQVELSEQKIFLPLSYGEAPYGDSIAQYAEDKFPGRVVAMRNFMPIHQYNRTIASCGIVIMNHYRQQAFGNVLAFIYLGAKVFLNDTSIYRYLKRIGCAVFLIEEDFQSKRPGVLDPLSEEEISRNRQLIAEEISTDVVVEKLRNAVSQRFSVAIDRKQSNAAAQAQPVVDVLMSVFNVASCLQESIDSVRKQSLDNFRLIIIDDGSTDNSWQIIEKIANRDSRIVCFKQEQQEALRTRDRLLSLANAEYVSWIDAGDVMHPQRLEKHVSLLQSQAAINAVSSNLGYLNSTRVDRTPSDVAEIQVRTLFEWVVKDQGTMRRSVFQNSEFSFAECGFVGAEAEWLWSNLAANESIAVIGEALCFHRPHTAQERQQKAEQQRIAQQEIISRQLLRFGIDVSEVEDKTALYSNGKSNYTVRSVEQAGVVYRALLENNQELKFVSQPHLDSYLTNNYRGLCRRIGPRGVLQYLRVMGVRKLLQGHKFGLLFIRDCLFRNQ